MPEARRRHAVKKGKARTFVQMWGVDRHGKPYFLCDPWLLKVAPQDPAAVGVVFEIVCLRQKDTDHPRPSVSVQELEDMSHPRVRKREEPMRAILERIERAGIVRVEGDEVVPLWPTHHIHSHEARKILGRSWRDYAEDCAALVH